jgi:hypothetical protein
MGKLLARYLWDVFAAIVGIGGAIVLYGVWHP